MATILQNNTHHGMLHDTHQSSVQAQKYPITNITELNPSLSVFWYKFVTIFKICISKIGPERHFLNFCATAKNVHFYEVNIKYKI